MSIVYGKRPEDGAVMIKGPVTEYIDNEGAKWYVIGDAVALTLLLDKLYQMEMAADRVIN